MTTATPSFCVATAGAPRREEEEEDGLGALLHLDTTVGALRAHADDVARRRGGRPHPGGDRAQPAQDVRRRLGHGTADGAPGSGCSSSSSATTLRPWPHQRHTTSST